MKTYMFPGQGSQSRGMGGTLFDRFPELTAQADGVLGYSIKALCSSDAQGELNKTQFTQPALYVVNALSYLAKVEETGRKPDYLAGHSLGEFSALYAAGCFDFEVGLRIVQKRGELMARATNGGMAAIVNATKEEIEERLQRGGLNNIDLANFNTPSQIVISGPLEEISKAQAFFQEGKIRYYPLNTSGAFHSRAMHDARDEFRAFLEPLTFNDLHIPVISNVTARAYLVGSVIENLSNQIAMAVRWSETIQHLMQTAAEQGSAMEFEEVGHGDVLTKLVHTIKQQTKMDASAAKPALAAIPESKPAAVTSAAEATESSDLDSSDVNSRDVNSRVAAWNRRHPIGTKVKSLTLKYEGLETRTEALVLFGHRAAVYLKGYNGYFDLDETVPA